MKNNKEEVLDLLGCESTDKPGVYQYKDFKIQLDLSEVSVKELISYIASRFYSMGYVDCQERIKQTLGLE